MSKKGNLAVSKEKIAEKSEKNRNGDILYLPSGTAFRVHLRVLCIYPKKEILPNLMKE
jgi:hypothetical protein